VNNEHLVVDELEPVSETGKPCIYIQRGAEIVCRQARNLALMGLNDSRIALGLGISRNTFYRYVKWFPEFSDALQSGRELAHAEVFDALYQRALGYSHPDTKVLSTREGVEVIPITKYYPPDVKAIELILTNRQSQYWKSASRIELVTGDAPEKSDVPEVDFENLSDEELMQLEQLVRKGIGHHAAVADDSENT
jgi:hypothetical protein